MEVNRGVRWGVVAGRSSGGCVLEQEWASSEQVVLMGHGIHSGCELADQGLASLTSCTSALEVGLWYGMWKATQVAGVDCAESNADWSCWQLGVAIRLGQQTHMCGFIKVNEQSVNVSQSMKCWR